MCVRSWQPSLLKTFIDELSQFADAVDYVRTRRGHQLCTVLALCEWNYGDCGDFVADESVQRLHSQRFNREKISGRRSYNRSSTRCIHSNGRVLT